MIRMFLISSVSAVGVTRFAVGSWKSDGSEVDSSHSNPNSSPSYSACVDVIVMVDLYLCTEINRPPTAMLAAEEGMISDFAGDNEDDGEGAVEIVAPHVARRMGKVGNPGSRGGRNDPSNWRITTMLSHTSR